LSFVTLLNQAFENVGANIANLDEVRDLLAKIENEADSISHVISLLELEMAEVDITLRTDIRILINEFKHLSEERRTS